MSNKISGMPYLSGICMWRRLERDIKEHRYSLSTLTCCPEFFYAEVKEAWTQGYYNFFRNEPTQIPIIVHVLCSVLIDINAGTKNF